MYTVVLLAAMTAGENVAEFHFKGGGGGCYGAGYAGGCRGGYGSCYGCGGGFASPYYGGCYGQASYGCSGCYGGGWGRCHGGSCYGACYGGCYGGGYTASGGCWGASYSGYGMGCYGGHGGCSGMPAAGYGCAGGCGGYVSPAYGVPSMGVGIPMSSAAPAVGDGKTGMAAGALGNRARLVFKLPEGAKLFIDGTPVNVTPENNSFRTPELKPATKYFYEARVEIVQDGKSMTGVRKIYVSAGQTVEEDLTSVEMKPDLLVTTR